jgi:glycosyltransferase involved in cell wall biosynthesis
MSATSDKRKGFHLLQPALIQMSQTEFSRNMELVVFGASSPKNPLNMGMKTHYTGRMYDDYSLALLYSAADVLIAPSLQDNLPYSVIESLACGTPCVAFNVGGMPDMIKHKENGYLAKPYESRDLAQGIIWILEDENRRKMLSFHARKKAEQ